MRTPHLSPRPRVVPTLAVAALLLAACGEASGEDLSAGADRSAEPSSADEAAEPFTLRIGVVTSDREVGGVIGFAHEEGLLVDHLEPFGVTDVEFFQFVTGPPTIAALEAGELDLVQTGDVPSILAAAEGLDSRLVQFATVQNESWIIGQPDGPTDVAGLAGGTVVAGNPPGATAPERFLRSVLEAEGVIDDVTISNLAGSDAVNALEGGQVDAITTSGATAVRLESNGYRVLFRASDAPELTFTSTTVGLGEFLDRRPGFATAFSAAFTEAAQRIHDDFDTFLERESRVTDEPVELLERIHRPELYPTEQFPQIGLELLDYSVEFLVSTGALDEPFDVRGWLYDE